MRPAGERIMPGGRGREGLGRVRVIAGGVLAFLSGRDQPRRPGTRMSWTGTGRLLVLFS